MEFKIGKKYECRYSPAHVPGFPVTVVEFHEDENPETSTVEYGNGIKEKVLLSYLYPYKWWEKMLPSIGTAILSGVVSLAVSLAFYYITKT